MIKKCFSTAVPSMLLYALLSVSAQASIYDLTGVVTGATGAFASLTPVGTPIAGPIDVTNGFGDISVGGFCFSNQAVPLCAGALVPITSVNLSALTLLPGQNAGGVLDVTAFSPTFQVSILISMDFDAGTFLADGGALGTVSGNVKLSPQVVPIPAAMWLFGSALAGLGFARRRKSS